MIIIYYYEINNIILYRCPSVLRHCWLGYVSCPQNDVYYVSGGALNHTQITHSIAKSQHNNIRYLAGVLFAVIYNHRVSSVVVVFCSLQQHRQRLAVSNKLHEWQSNSRSVKF